MVNSYIDAKQCTVQPVMLHALGKSFLNKETSREQTSFSSLAFIGSLLVTHFWSSFGPALFPLRPITLLAGYASNHTCPTQLSRHFDQEEIRDS